MNLYVSYVSLKERIFTSLFTSLISPGQLIITAGANKAAFLKDDRQTDRQTDSVDKVNLLLILRYIRYNYFYNLMGINR
jgi:hypothetical protein